MQNGIIKVCALYYKQTEKENEFKFPRKKMNLNFQQMCVGAFTCRCERGEQSSQRSNAVEEFCSRPCELQQVYP